MITASEAARRPVTRTAARQVVLSWPTFRIPLGSTEFEDRRPAFGALLSVLSTYRSIAFIFVVQLNAAITPRIWRHDRF